MEVKGAEERLVNASIYIKNAILELKNIKCECNDDDYCTRCMLVDDTKNLKGCIDDEIRELLK